VATVNREEQQPANGIAWIDDWRNQSILIHHIKKTETQSTGQACPFMDYRFFGVLSMPLCW